MAKRVKQTGPALKTREDMEMIVGEIAELTLRRDALTVQMDVYIQEVRDRYAKDLDAIGARLDVTMTLARAWCEANPEAFGDAKSIEMTQAMVGFRTGNPALKERKGWNQEKIIEAMKKTLLWIGYIRNKETIDKEAILADRKRLPAESLKAIGMKIEQEESFFVDPKREQLEPARVVDSERRSA